VIVCGPADLNSVVNEQLLVPAASTQIGAPISSA